MVEGVEHSKAERIRDEILGLTSELRNTATALVARAGDPAQWEAITQAGRALTAAVGQWQLEPLARSGRALDRLTQVAATLATAVHEGAREAFGTIPNAVGLFEQSLEGCLDGVPGAHLDGLYDILRGSFPAGWHSAIELDDASFDQLLGAVLHPVTAETAGPAPAGTGTDADNSFHQQLLEAFTTEAAERSNQCEELLLQLERRPGDRELLDQIFRQLHTLKGAAAAIDLNAAAAQLHAGESVLELARGGAAPIDTGALVDLLLRIIDSVRGLIDRARGNSDSPYTVIADVGAEVGALKASATHHVPEPAGTAGTAAAPAPPVARPVGALPTMDAFLTEQLDAVAALRDQLPAGEVEGQLHQYIDALDQQAKQFWQIATNLRERLQSLRLIPLEGVLRRLQRPLRDAARGEGKRASLRIIGGDLRVDRHVAERLYGPLMHLVRNAVSHGIEAPAARLVRGKTDAGTVCIRAEQRPDAVVVSVEDDGAGLDLAAIRAKAERLHWIEPTETADRDALVQLIFRAGFSTRDDASGIAGRGVGMDAVAHEIGALHGRIEVDSRPGEGTAFRLVLPVAESAGQRPPMPPSPEPGSSASRTAEPLAAAPISDVTPRRSG